MKRIIDVCCGGRMFWFNKNNPDVVFMDNRQFSDTLCDGRHFEVKPDVVGDFRNIPFPDSSFSLVVFDPPHLLHVGEKSWLAKKYGHLNLDTYIDDLKQGFSECFRILKPNGVLVFKWNETDVKTSEIIKLSPIKPLFGHKSGRLNKTQWLVFIKEREQE
jgi:ubiquinone/menaquinone biosynthesis C-methylase UbiE